MVANRILAAAGAAIGVLVFGSALGSGALWHDSVSVDGGQVRAGELALLNGNAAVQSASYAFDELAGSLLHPGSWAQAPLTIKNGGSVDLDYRLTDTSASGSSLLAGALVLTVQRVETGGSCPTGVEAADPTGTTTPLYSGPAIGADTTSPRTLPVAASEPLCIRFTVAESATPAAQGQNTQITFTFSAVVT